MIILPRPWFAPSDVHRACGCMCTHTYAMHTYIVIEKYNVDSIRIDHMSICNGWLCKTFFVNINGLSPRSPCSSWLILSLCPGEVEQAKTEAPKQFTNEIPCRIGYSPFILLRLAVVSRSWSQPLVQKDPSPRTPHPSTNRLCSFGRGLGCCADFWLQLNCKKRGTEKNAVF